MKPPAGHDGKNSLVHTTKCLNANTGSRIYDCVCHTKKSSVDLRLNNREVMKRFLRYGLSPINFRYNLLTTNEQKLVTREEFEALVEELKE